MQRHETAMKAALEAALHVTWPTEPILVDVLGETGPKLGHHSQWPNRLRGTHPSLRRQSVQYRHCAAEVAVSRGYTHPASGRPHRCPYQINEETARQRLQPVPNLWHALLLFTPGEIAKRELGQTEKVDYVRYPYCKLQLTPAEQAALERDWEPYLDGNTSFENALHDLVRDAR